jgi:hypothetical protein
MRKELLFSLVIAAIILLIGSIGNAVVADDLADRVQYDLAAEQVFAGTAHDRPNVFEGRMYFTLWTSKGMVAVEIGPEQFVKRSGFRLGPGELVTVVGMPVILSGREMVLAREVTKTGSILVVRDRKGRPVWHKDRVIEMDPEVGDAGLPVC